MAKTKGDLIVFSLTSMQVAIISVGAIILLLFCFLLGIRVGERKSLQKATSASKVKKTPPQIDIEEQEAAETSATEDKGELTFTEALTEIKPTPKEKPVVAKAPVTTTEVTEIYEKYALQVASLRKKEAAENYSEKLSNKGYFTYVEEADLEDKGIWYRVKLGGFPTIGEANAMKDTLQHDHGIKSLVVPK